MGALVRIAIFVGLSTLAWAGKDDDATAQARAHFRKGLAQYVLNHYDEAIAEFEAGYACSPLPAFLFNLAQSHARAGRKEKAIEFYRKYLDMGAPQQDVVMVQEAIERLERELRAPPVPEPPPKMVPESAAVETHVAARPAPAAEKPTPAVEKPAPSVEKPTPAVEKPAPAVEKPAPAAATPAIGVVAMPAGRAKKYAGMATAAVGVAALVTGMALSLTAGSYSNELTRLDQTHGEFDQSKSSNGKTFDAAGASMLAIGGVALVAGVVVAVLGFRESRRAKRTASGVSVSF